MPNQLIKGRQIVADSWQTVSVTDEVSLTALPAGKVIISAQLWLARRQNWIARCKTGEEIGVSIAPAFRLEDIVGDLSWFSTIAIEFPKFADGRGYSTARLLRERYGYKGELRAVGDVGRDQLFLLQRVGFDAFLIPEGRDAQAALASFNDFPEVYQAAHDQTLPLFRRRSATL